MGSIRRGPSVLRMLVLAAVSAVLATPATQAQSAKSKSNSATAALHISVTVVPVIEPATAPLPEPPAGGSLSYSLQGGATPSVTRQVTVVSVPSQNFPGSNSSPAYVGVMETTTVVIQ